jgi:hypothetical protein
VLTWWAFRWVCWNGGLNSDGSSPEFWWEWCWCCSGISIYEERYWLDFVTELHIFLGDFLLIGAETLVHECWWAGVEVFEGWDEFVDIFGVLHIGDLNA